MTAKDKSLSLSKQVSFTHSHSPMYMMISYSDGDVVKPIYLKESKLKIPVP